MTRYTRNVEPSYVEVKKIIKFGEINNNGLCVVTLEDGSHYAIDSIIIGETVDINGENYLMILMGSERSEFVITNETLNNKYTKAE